tara:strand:+ start:1640 stop:3421 length:1782 start_codon:yes stop_codon:yes gene_type:complete
MKYFYYVAFSLLIYSCSSIEIVEESSPELTQINENTKFKNFLDSEWDKSLNENPLFASYVGDKRNNNKINSNSIEQFNNEKQSNIESLSNLKKIDISKLSDENVLNYKLYEFGVRRNIDLANFPTYFLRINQRGGIQSFYETGNRLVYTNSQDYYDWLSRLVQFSENIEIFLEINKKGLLQGVTQPKMITQSVITQIDKIINSDIDKNPYMKVFLEADETLISISEKTNLINDAQQLILNKIIPAYIDLNNFLKDEYLPNSRDSIGISDVPGGKVYYEYLTQFYTTTDLTPDQIHQIGLDEIKRIRTEMEEIIQQVNWNGDFNSFLNYLRTNPRFYYDNPNDLFNAYLIMSKTIDPLLPKIFKVFPRAPYGVIPIPEESAPFTTTAYYNSPSPGRPGYFYANLYKPESRPKYEIPVLTVHEAVPGHHFQISIAQELENVPEFRKYQGITAFVEGWGLYSEELGEFMGIYEDPYDKFGQLTYDMWRAIRLVVDTGMHYKNWSRDEAVNLFIENSAKSILDINNEIDRYIAWPGQALAYKIGQLKILELRNKAEEMLGDKYDIKDFHYEVLKRGSLPLDLLEFYIDEWINTSLNS